MKETCQPGVDEWGLPGWCVEHDLTESSFILQGIIELIILLVIFFSFRAFFKYRLKKKLEKNPPSIWEPKVKNRYKK